MWRLMFPPELFQQVPLAWKKLQIYQDLNIVENICDNDNTPNSSIQQM